MAGANLLNAVQIGRTNRQRTGQKQTQHKTDWFGSVFGSEIIIQNIKLFITKMENRLLIDHLQQISEACQWCQYIR